MFKTNLLKLTLGLAVLITATTATAQDRYWKKTRSPDGSGAFYEYVSSGLYEGEYAHVFLPITGEAFRHALYLHELSPNQRQTPKAREVTQRLTVTIAKAHRRDSSSRLGRLYEACVKKDRELDRQIDMILSEDNPYTPENYDRNAERGLPVGCFITKVMFWSTARLRVSLRTDLFAEAKNYDLPIVATQRIFQEDFEAVPFPPMDSTGLAYKSWNQGNSIYCFSSLASATEFSDALLDPDRDLPYRADFEAEERCRYHTKEGIVRAIANMNIRADHLSRELNRRNPPFFGMGVYFDYGSVKGNRVRIPFLNLGSLIRKEL